MAEDRFTRFYDDYVSLPSTDWFGRLLAPEGLLESLPLASGSWAALPGWSAGQLSVPLIHPGCLPNNEAPIQHLLGISTEELNGIAYGADRRKPATLLPLLSAIELPARGAPATDHRSAHLRNLALHEARPEWLILTVLPLPPAPLLTAPAARQLSDLQERSEKVAVLLDLKAPEVIIHGQTGFFQDQLDRFFDVMVESLRERLRQTS